MNWDTNELCLWILNDEPLYRDVSRMQHLALDTENFAGRLQAYFRGNPFPTLQDIDFREVDWQAIAEELMA